MTVVVYSDGKWHDANTPLTGPMDHSFWMASSVFDGARSFDGYAPDLDRHCERLVRSAKAMLLAPTIGAAEIETLCREGVRRFPKSAELYIRPMFYATDGFVVPEPASTKFCIVIHDMPMPPETGFTAAIASRRRPRPDQAPTDAKASCLYPNSARALKEAADRGFENAIMLDADGNVAEFAAANIWLGKNGVAVTPRESGMLLPGVTRRRVMELLRAAGVPVEERTVTVADLFGADEVFCTGNYGKVLPVTRVEHRDFQPGPIGKRARDLYFDFARKTEPLL